MKVEIEESAGLAVYDVPVVQGMKVMDVLDYIHANLNHELAYYRHSSCCQAICGRCACKLDGRAILPCAKEVDAAVGTMHLSPADGTIIRDLVVIR